jgi:hypothetical protein
MNTKRWIIASLVVFVASGLMELLIHGVLLVGAYEATAHLWRPEAEMSQNMWMFWLYGFIWSFILVYIFAKGYEGKGIMEGVRFGLLIGVFFSLPMSLGTYASMPITAGLAIGWFVYGVIEMTIMGVIAALIYKPKGELVSTAAA